MDFAEALSIIALLVAACWLVARLLKHREHTQRHAASAATRASEDGSLTQGEVEALVRRVVREEVQRATRPLQENLERLDERGARGNARDEKRPRRDLPGVREDPHDVGLLAGDDATDSGEHAA